LTDAYVSINELLGDKVNTLPSKIRNTSLSTEQDAQKHIGTYEELSGIHNGETLEITTEGKDLYTTMTTIKEDCYIFMKKNLGLALRETEPCLCLMKM
jgi:hypothetical protein